MIKSKKKIIHKQILSRDDKRNSEIKFFNKKIKNTIKKSSMDNIISIDESSIDTHLDNNEGWSKFGSKVTQIKRHQRIRYSLILAICNKKIIHYQIIKNSVNGETFLNFMKDLIHKLDMNNTYHIVMDNAKIHHYKKLTKYIIKKSNIEIIYNIPYTPETNPIEHVFNDIKRYIKKKVLNNYNIITIIKRSLGTIKKSNLNNYFNNSLITELNRLMLNTF